MYLFTVCDASEPIRQVNYLMGITQKTMVKGVVPSEINCFKHEDYVCMYIVKALTNVVNRCISFKLYQVSLIISI